MKQLFKDVQSFNCLASKFQKEAARLGLTKEEYITLGCITSQPHKLNNLVTMIQELYCDDCDKKKSSVKTLVTQKINNLTAKGFITKTQDENDKRTILLILTEKGINAQGE